MNETTVATVRRPRLTPPDSSKESANKGLAATCCGEGGTCGVRPTPTGFLTSGSLTSVAVLMEPSTCTASTTCVHSTFSLHNSPDTMPRVTGFSDRDHGVLSGTILMKAG